MFIPVIYFYFPETAQFSLEEIEENFGDELAVHVAEATRGRNGNKHEDI